MITNAGLDIGLNLNTAKCEQSVTQVVISPTPFFWVYVKSETELLGAPLFPGTALDSAWSKRCDELARAVDKLALINAQDALILLRASFSAPRVQHLLRCSPSVNNSSLQIFDNLLTSDYWICITNSALSDTQWPPASLPIKQGGLGVRRITLLAIPAFLASAASTPSLQEQILSSCTCSSDSFLDSYLTDWSPSFGMPPDPLPSKQSFWDWPSLQADRSVIEAFMVEPSQMAWYLASGVPHSGDWLLALPITNCGPRLKNETLRVADWDSTCAFLTDAEMPVWIWRRRPKLSRHGL